jgi:hypothetical protein
MSQQTQSESRKRTLVVVVSLILTVVSAYVLVPRDWLQGRTILSVLISPDKVLRYPLRPLTLSERIEVANGGQPGTQFEDVQRVVSNDLENFLPYLIGLGGIAGVVVYINGTKKRSPKN